MGSPPINAIPKVVCRRRRRSVFLFVFWLVTYETNENMNTRLRSKQGGPFHVIGANVEEQLLVWSKSLSSSLFLRCWVAMGGLAVPPKVGRAS